MSYQDFHWKGSLTLCRGAVGVSCSSSRLAIFSWKASCTTKILQNFWLTRANRYSLNMVLINIKDLFISCLKMWININPTEGENLPLIERYSRKPTQLSIPINSLPQCSSSFLWYIYSEIFPNFLMSFISEIFLVVNQRVTFLIFYLLLIGKCYNKKKSVI